MSITKKEKDISIKTNCTINKNKKNEQILGGNISLTKQVDGKTFSMNYNSNGAIKGWIDWGSVFSEIP